MGSTVRNMLIVFLASLSLFALAAFVISFLEVPALDLLTQLYWNWVWANTAEWAMALFPAAAAFAVVIGVGVVIDPLELAREGRRQALVKFLISFALFAGIVHVVFVLALLPEARAARERVLSATEVVRHHRDRFDTHLDNGAFSRARRSAESIAMIVPALDEETGERLSLVAEAVERTEETSTLEESTEETEAGRRTAQSATEAFERAREAMEQGDWFTAHLYARRAYNLDPRLTSARSLAEEAWSMIESNIRGDERTELFERKRSGLRALTEDRPVEAYYLFRDLADEHPDDEDVQRYLSEAQDALSDQAFFLRDVGELTGVPGENNVIFTQESDLYRYEILQFDRLIGEPAVRYALGVEAVGLDDDGQVAYHLRAPVGSFVNGSLSVRALHPDNRAESVDAQYLEGSRPRGMESLIPLETGITQLQRVALAQSDVRRMNGMDLLRIYGDSSVSEFVRRSAEQELFRRLLAPFSVVLLVLLGGATGFAGRSRYADNPPLLSFLLLPVLGVSAVLAFDLLQYLQTIGAGLLHIAFPFGVVVSGLLFLQGLLVVLALAYLVRCIQ
ncbi:MAG: hypothetical protein ACOCRN_04400 [Spirochaetia bacterium]